MQTLVRSFGSALHNIFLFSCGPMEKIIAQVWLMQFHRNKKFHLQLPVDSVFFQGLALETIKQFGKTWIYSTLL